MVAPMKRFVLREHRDPERKGENRFVVLELEVRGGYISICGIIGFSLGQRNAKYEEKTNLTSNVLLRARRVYFAEGVGQTTKEIREFFPEMRPYMGRHMEHAVPEDMAWLTRKFTRSKELTPNQLEEGWK